MKSTLKLVTVNLAVLAMLVVVVELIFGSWLKGPDYGSLNLPRDVHQVFDVSTLYEGGGTTRYSRDEHGLRGPYDDLSKIDILTIGGSTANQLYIDDGLTWQAVMRRLFAAAGEPRTIVDAAVDGQSTRGHIALFDRWFPLIPDLRMTYVLAYVGINDMAVDEASQWDQMESPEADRRLRYWIMNRSALYNLFRTGRGMFKAWNAKLVHGASPHDGRSWEPLHPLAEAPPPPPELEEPLAAYEGRLRVLVDRIRAWGAEPILVTQPSAEYRLEDGWVLVSRNADGILESQGYETLAAFNRTTLRVCREVGALCLDLAAGVAFEDGDFYDRVHNTPRGAEKVGRFMVEGLRGRL